MHNPESNDRLLRNARREAIIVMIVWVCTLAWTLGYCYLHGYQHPPDSWLVRSGWAVERSAENLRQFWGLPDWIALGVVVPWMLCTFFTIVFGLFIMQDDQLGTEAQEETEHGP